MQLGWAGSGPTGGGVPENASQEGSRDDAEALLLLPRPLLQGGQGRPLPTSRHTTSLLVLVVIRHAWDAQQLDVKHDGGGGRHAGPAGGCSSRVGGGHKGIGSKASAPQGVDPRLRRL